MNQGALAKIRWLSKVAGGRQKPPTGLQYVTVASFQPLPADEDVTPMQWSLRIESTLPLDRAPIIRAHVRFVAEDAPVRLLNPGHHFTLHEGGGTVASGEIVAESPADGVNPDELCPVAAVR